MVLFKAYHLRSVELMQEGFSPDAYCIDSIFIPKKDICASFDDHMCSSLGICEADKTGYIHDLNMIRKAETIINRGEPSKHDGDMIKEVINPNGNTDRIFYPWYGRLVGEINLEESTIKNIAEHSKIGEVKLTENFDHTAEGLVKILSGEYIVKGFLTNLK